MGWHRYDSGRRCLVLTLHVQPKARASGLAGPHGDALKVRIAAPAVDDKANTALIEFIAQRLGVRRSSVTIRHGATGRRKIVEVAGGPELAARLERLRSIA